MIFIKLQFTGKINDLKHNNIIIHHYIIISIHNGAPLYALNYGPSTAPIGEVKTPINKTALEGSRRKLEDIVKCL